MKANGTLDTFEWIDLQWFAAEDEGRTEEPSDTKLRRARQEEGRVPKSQELNSALVMMLVVISLVFLGSYILRQCVLMFRFFFMRAASVSISAAFVEAFYRFYLKLVLPIAAIGMAGAVAGNIVQNGEFIFTTKPLAPNFGKIVPKFGEYFKNTLFSMRGLFNVAKSIGKVAVLAIIAYMFIKRAVLNQRSPAILMEIRNGDIPGALGTVARMSGLLLVVAAVVFLIIAIPDYFVQRHEFMEHMKMTKQEVKEELKEEEGDPEIKNKLQQAQKQLLQQNIPKAVKESDVVITNPTHFAVALKYDRITMPAPQVMAKGEDRVALFIKQIARENNVPMVENRPLARGLYTETEVGDIIPSMYFRAISEVYKYINFKL